MDFAKDNTFCSYCQVASPPDLFDVCLAEGIVTCWLTCSCCLCAARCPELPKSDGEIDTEGYASSSDDEDAGLVIALDVAKDGKETGNAMEATDRKERVVSKPPVL